MSGIRFSGIASGMDTETMVKQLMDAEKIRLNKYNQEKQITQWTQEAYNDVNKDIANFILDTKKELGVSFGGSIGSASWIKKATSSDTSIFDATANSSAASGTHSLKVVQLAEGVTLGSASAIQNSGEDKTVDQLGVGAVGAFSININGESISLDSSNTLSDVVSAINSKTDVTGVKASYDSSIGRLFLNTSSTGSSSKIEITGDTHNLFVDPDGAGAGESILKTNMSANGGDITSSDPAIYVGKDAIIDFDGANGIKYSSNNITINGINIDLKSADAGTEHTIKVDTDVDGVYDKIKGFVDKYNELLDKLNKKIGEKSYRDYKPLTDDQKEAMDEKTIDLWEEKAKSGLLKNNEHITKLLGNTRSGLYESVYSDFDNDTKLSGFSFLTEIGITTGTYQERGKLKIDEDKLKEAITNDVDGVMDLLFKTPDETKTDKEKRAETGLINRLYDDMIDGMKDIIDKSGTGDNALLYREVKSTILIDFVTKSGSISLLDKDVLNIEKQISRENSRLSSIEDRYWRQFTAMEKAMNQMNSQSSWLMSQMGGM
ncbi:flagellar filament capping protein FliD [Tepidibacter aestuarii]|uniref:flagellar filament capping protein FliD n=1 Tax=Tepidibacter aestuarii TaxID=2925782 RepID=UPI00209A7A39|nr:flagellar filament capping protein FliD [Tepidibacter aestuarii]CAH2211903.1 Flagellar hook-associated protein 2 [Tepidibacter aestuarii]